jgi:hypothetical protein
MLFGQTIQNPVSEPIGSLITITQMEQKEKEETNSNDEGTNNPVVTGSTEYIQGTHKYYIKSNEQITIIYEEKKP